MLRTGLAAMLACSAIATATAAQPVDLSGMSGAELTAFARAMPKGGELHLHLSGAVYAESYLRWAEEDGLCVDQKVLAIRPPPCEGDLVSASQVAADDVLRTALYDSLTTRKPGFAGRSGHDQFFTAFGRMGAAPTRVGDMLAEVMRRLAAQNTWYLELMVTPQGAATRDLAAQVGWRDGDLAAQKAALSAVGLEKLVSAATAGTDAMEARARQVLGCGAAGSDPGCEVTVRYLVQTNRQAPPEQTFAQIQLGAALVAADPRWVGMQMVAPEDHPVSLRNYRLHMRMLAYLTDGGRSVPLALHAGEVSHDFATPEDMSFHIAEAVRVAGARRIGHGLAIAHEDGAQALVRELADKGVLVEINLTSNAVILGVEVDEHPYRWLREQGVPTSLSTDDPGILRIDLSHEYARAAREGASYADLKASARNALAFSFLKGEGLWRDPGAYKQPHPACAREVGRDQPQSASCIAFIAGSDRAREQHRLEAKLSMFEAAR